MSDGIDHGPGVENVYWDNLGEGWRMDCAGCDFATTPCARLTDAADEVVDHWFADHQQRDGVAP